MGRIKNYNNFIENKDFPTISGRYIQLLDKQFNLREIKKFRTSNYLMYEKLYDDNFNSCINLQNKIEIEIAKYFHKEFFELEDSKLNQIKKIEILENILDKTLNLELKEEKRLMNKFNKVNRTSEIFYNLLTFEYAPGEIDFEFNKYIFFRTFLGEIKNEYL